MKKAFYLGIVGLALFELANVYFIMPFPGSQRMDSIDLAHFLHRGRWVFRGALGLLAIAGFRPAFRQSRWLSLLAIGASAGVVYTFNFEIVADKMFREPRDLRFADARDNRVGLDKLVLGVEIDGDAKAYPIQFIGYHHQVRDEVGGDPIMVTYCTVCRSGRVYVPAVAGRPETFRLVGMDHFNALLEDDTTGSWWRQATGEAVAGPLRGSVLPELRGVHVSLREWLALHPQSLIMQPDGAFSEEYEGLATYDSGTDRGPLTATDTRSWQDKSWVVGIAVGEAARAFDWNRLKSERVIHDRVGEHPVVLALADDDQSFFAFERETAETILVLEGDVLRSGERSWNLSGEALGKGYGPLRPIAAYQEFWHSWRTFHPRTTRY